MNKSENDLPLVTVCVITYNRLDILRQTVEALRTRCTYPRNRMEWILCDDGSPAEVQNEMRNLPFDNYIFALKNQGLGKNTNKGILAASGKYIFQLQDDCVLTGRGDFIEAAIGVMDQFTDIGMVRFIPLKGPSPFECRNAVGIGDVFVMKDNLRQIEEHPGFAAYTDQPHLKRASFHKELGLYKEKVPMTKMEKDFVLRVANQEAHRVSFIPGYDVFSHIGESTSFNPGVKREALKKRLLENPITRLPFVVYLFIKHEIFKKYITSRR